MTAPLRATRSDNRLTEIHDAAAHLFREKGYAATSMRDIAEGVSMLPGSLYYHFAAKEDLLASVYAEGVRQISERVQAAVARQHSPWERLEAAAIAHLESLLGGSDYAQVVIRVLPEDVPRVAARLTRMRDGYEKMFAELIAALQLPVDTDRHAFRLMLIGALNWSQTWFRAEGRASPRSIARSYLRLLREAQWVKGESKWASVRPKC